MGYTIYTDNLCRKADGPCFFTTCFIFFIFFLIFYPFFPTSGHALIRITMPDLAMQLDSNILIPVDLASNDPGGFNSWNLTINYDPNIITFLEMISSQLTKNYRFLIANETFPGNILVLGAVNYNKDTGEDIPTIGTGTLFRLRFAAKRNYPMRKTQSDIIITPKQSSGNSLLQADFSDIGSIEIQPAFEILRVDPSIGPVNEEMTIRIFGTGFDTSALPIIGPIQGRETRVYEGQDYIETKIPSNSLESAGIYDITVTNANGDFGILKGAYKAVDQFTLHLANGFNLIALPPFSAFFDRDKRQVQYSARTLSEAIAQIRKIYRWEAGWKVFSNEGGMFSGEDFDLGLGKGYFVFVEQGVDFTFYGMPAAGPVQIDLIQGFNLVSFKDPVRLSYDAKTILEETGAEKIYDWSFGWKVYTGEAGQNFPLEKTKGYFLFCSGADTWPPHMP